MAYRTTPIPATGKTPSELIMGRQIRTSLPTMTKVLEPKLANRAAVMKAAAETKRSTSEYKRSFDRRNGTRELSQLHPGDWVQMLRRTRKHLTKVPAPSGYGAPEDDILIPEIN